MDVEQFVQELSESSLGEVAHVRRFAPRAATFGERRAPMHPDLDELLKKLGLARLYSHQALAYDAAMSGEDLAVVSGTNSGKTLCYNLPAAQMCLAEPAARALYLYPTKALAQDQRGKLEELVDPIGVRVATYDGDTPTAHRAAIRKQAHVIMTNPDMLHVGILPAHEQWTKLFKSLRLVVLDEMHAYRGVFGSHVGGIVRRLLRLCEWHRARPQIIACSATIGNPDELFEMLTGRTPRVITEDGAPRARRTFLFWNPPLVSGAPSSGQARASANLTTATLMASLAEAGLRTLAFSRARVSAELVLRYARDRVAKRELVQPEAIESYRAGYTPRERREIEKGLFEGALLGLSSTNAMELGVDIGGLDAVLMNGYPGTISSFWQQAGRAGRGEREGLAIMIAHDDPLEQYLSREPDMILSAEVERVAANPHNPQVLSQQIRCAAYERPIGPSELEAFGAGAMEVAESLDRSGELQFSSGLFYCPSHDPPARKVNIRSTGGDQVTLYCQGRELGVMEWWRALQSAHAGAVYLHRGVGYVVESLDLDRLQAHLVEHRVPYYTQPILQSVIEPRYELAAISLGKSRAALSAITVTDLVVGFREKSLDGDTVLATLPLDMPPLTYETIAVQFDLHGLRVEEEPEKAVGAVHGMEHATTAVAPILAGSDRGDLGSAWYGMFPSTHRPAIFVFDRIPGGVGLAERLYESIPRWLPAARQLLAGCQCDAGCPACLMSSRCEANNESLDKQAAMDLLASLS